MKKIILASLIVVIAATSSFGSDTASLGASAANAGMTLKSGTATIGKLSTGDVLAWITGTTGYAIITQHINGVKAFGTSHDSTAITWQATTKGAYVAATAPTASDSGSVTGTGWSVM
jgi:hypothetical protein